MAPLSADRNTTRADVAPGFGPVKGSTTIYQGALVCYDANGYYQPGADTAGLTFDGVARERADNSSGSDGDINVETYKTGVFRFNATGLAQKDVGAKLYIADDNTVKLGQAVTNGIYVGVLDHFVSATIAPVRIDVIDARGKRGDQNVFIFEITGTNAAALDLSTIAASYGGADIYVDSVMFMNAITTSSGAFSDRQVVTTDYTLSGGDITCVGDKSSLTLQMAVLGRLED